MTKDQFVFVANAELDNPMPTIINLNQIVFARLVTGGILLQLAGNNSITVTGAAAPELWRVLMGHSIMTDGRQLPESAIPSLTP